MIDPRRASEIGRPLGIQQSDISEIGKGAIVARIIRLAQLTLPVIAKRSAWREVSILAVVGFVVEFVAQTVCSLTLPEPSAMLYGVYSR